MLFALRIQVEHKGVADGKAAARKEETKMAEKKIKENCLERMRRIDGERKIADFIVRRQGLDV